MTDTSKADYPTASGVRDGRTKRDHQFQGDKHEIANRNVRVAIDMLDDPELKELKDNDAPLMKILRHPKVRRKISEMRENQ